VASIEIQRLRSGILSGAVKLLVVPLGLGDLEGIAWSGGRAHLENVACQLGRVGSGEVEYLAVRVSGGCVVAKGGIDFAKEPGAGTIWQLATHPGQESLGLATRLISELEVSACRRGVHRVRLAVEVGNNRALRLYEHLGYEPIGESNASWEAEAPDGSRFLYTAQLTEMAKIV